MGHLLHAIRDRQPIGRSHVAALAHYTEQATLSGDATHLAALISRHPSYSAQELAALICAIAGHAADMERVGVHRFDEVSALLDKAADLANDSYMVAA